jgi:hypothetical protein
MKTIQNISYIEANSTIKITHSLKNSKSIESSKYKPSELESVFFEALTSLEKQESFHRIEVLENLCKEFLKTIT